MPELYLEAREKLLQVLCKVIYVAVTTDCWTSPTRDSYLTMAVHYIDDGLNKVSRVFVTRSLEVTHNFENLASVLSSIVDEWQLTGKLTARPATFFTVFTERIRLK